MKQYHTLGNIPVFNEKAAAVDPAAASACCAPRAPTGKPVGIEVMAASSCC